MRFKPNFVKDRVKEIYSEIWGLDVSGDGNTVFTAKNNSILVSDLGEKSTKCEEVYVMRPTTQKHLQCSDKRITWQSDIVTNSLL